MAMQVDEEGRSRGGLTRNADVRYPFRVAAYPPAFDAARQPHPPRFRCRVERQRELKEYDLRLIPVPEV